MCEGAITAGFLIVTSMFYTRQEQTVRVGYWCECFYLLLAAFRRRRLDPVPANDSMILRSSHERFRHYCAGFHRLWRPAYKH